MRNLLVLVLGVLLGAVLSALVMNALARRGAYARGLMQVLQHQVAQLRDHVRMHDCAQTFTADRTLLAMLVDRIDSAGGDDVASDPPFREYRARLSAAVTALPATATGCSGVAAQVDAIGQACETCHRQYR
jgi:cytochrome c556